MIVSLPPSAFDDELVVAPSVPVIVHQRRQAGDRDRPPLPATSIVLPPFVPLTVTVSACAVAGRAAERAGEVDVDLRDVGAAQVVDVDGVGAAERVEVDAARRRSGPW